MTTDKLTARIATLSTEQLKDISLRMALETSEEAIIVCGKIDDELCERLPEAEFIAHCEAIEALMDAAA